MPTKKTTTTKPAAEAKETPKAKKASGKYIFAVGRRKTATAKVKLFDGSGDFIVNDRKLDQYFPYLPWQKNAVAALAATGMEKNYDVAVRVLGGGLSAQSAAVAHGVARALVTKDEGFKKVLRGYGLLTRDPRMKERKKPGLKRARRAPQWSKR